MLRVLRTKAHKQENLSSRKKGKFKLDLKAEEGEESPMTSWVKVQRLKRSTQWERTEDSAIWRKDNQRGDR